MDAASPGRFHTFSAHPPGLGRNSSQNGDGAPPKKKPSRKRPNTGRRFQCDHEGCGKTYSRAEHLQRHQLNHAPKQLFNCDFAGCKLTFVRKDLRDRHRKRHRRPSATDSSPGDKETTNAASTPSGSENGDGQHLPDDAALRTLSDASEQLARARTSAGYLPGLSSIHKSSLPGFDSINNQLQYLEHTGDDRSQTHIHYSGTKSAANQDRSLPVFSPPQTQPYNVNPASLLPDADSTINTTRNSISHIQTPSMVDNRQSSFFQTLLPDPSGRTTSAAGTGTASYGNAFNTADMDMSYDPVGLDDGGLGISPSGRTDEFTSWLFNENGGASNPGHMYSTMYQPNVFGQIYYDELPASMFDRYADVVDENSALNEELTSTAYNIHSKEPGLSEWKRQYLISVIQERFSAGGSAAMAMKQQIFSGNVDDPSHVMSMNSLQIYLSAYWTRFHDQFPLLHKATFIPDQVHDCLLLAVLVVGASLLDDAQLGRPFCEAAAQLANFIAWSLRWQILTDPDSGPPAKLWVLQSLAILEFYEKMNATRALHERAHVHFAATLTLMRRGSALIGEQQSIPPSRDETTTTNEEAETTYASDKWWSHWIAQEATRRAAFGAFFLDALHATMFGHAATMVIHEIQLPLPCDDTLWSATTASEVGRIEFSLYTNGIKPTPFLVGIKRTLSCQKVRTNPFGRIILMAGLLSIAYHMHQKELYRSTLEEQNNNTNTSSGHNSMPEGWKAQILKAFDWWKQDFDESFVHMRSSGIDEGKTGFSQERGVISQHLATGLYHLGHIAVQVDMPDLCILAGAKVLLGRVITKVDYERVRRKMEGWAGTKGARHAVHYSIRYLKLTLFLEGAEKGGAGAGAGGGGGRRSSEQLWDARFAKGPTSPDTVLIRPWVMYFSALTLWAYGFLLDGPLRPFPERIYKPRALDSGIAQMSAEQVQEMESDAKAYLHVMGRAAHPNGLQGVSGGRNKVVGLLGVVLTALESSRWELLHEARTRLHNCLDQLR